MDALTLWPCILMLWTIFCSISGPWGSELNNKNPSLRVAHVAHVVNNSYLFWTSDRFCFLEGPERKIHENVAPLGEGPEQLNPSSVVTLLPNRMQVQLCMVKNSTLFWNPGRCCTFLVFRIYRLAMHLKTLWMHGQPVNPFLRVTLLRSVQ